MLLTKHHLEFLSLKVGYTGSSESILVKIPHWWKSHPVTAHFLSFFYRNSPKQLKKLKSSQLSLQTRNY